MAYIKISDPKIIDLPTIHQIINVVNQHSDNISAITNNFGSIYASTSTADSTTQTQFDISSQQIMYGTSTISLATGATFNGASNAYYYSKTINLAIPFTDAKGPTIILTPVTTSLTNTSVQDLIATVGTVNQSSFQIVLRKSGITTANHTAFGGTAKDGSWLGTGSVNINWIALGHK
jgi:hypothetical protein